MEEWNLTLERDLGKGIGVRASYDGNHSYNVPTLINYNQVHPNTLGIDDPAIQAQIPFPQLLFFQTASSDGFGNFQAGTVSVHKRASNFQFEASYTFTRNLSNLQGYGNSRRFTNEFGNELSDPYNPGLDYGNVPFSRRNRFLATFLYELPFGKGKYFLNNVNPVVDKIVGGFVLSGLALFQSGPFLTVSTYNDPSGTGYNLLFANGGRADTVKGVDPYQGQSIQQWINPTAFAEPDNNIGRFGNSQQRLCPGAIHQGCVPLAAEADRTDRIDAAGDWRAGLECLQPSELRSARQPEHVGSRRLRHHLVIAKCRRAPARGRSS